MIGPVLPRERIEVIDILRGFALFGVLLINMRNFDLPGQKWAGTADQVALWLTIFFGDSKFWTLFSFLFGLGFALQMGRLEARAARFLPVYLRRLFVLLLFGVLHHLIYGGDILFDYAVVGFLLLLFRACSSRTILVVACVCLVIPMVQFALDVRARELRRASPPASQQATQEAAQREAKEKAREEEYVRVYSRGRLTEVMGLNAHGFARSYSTIHAYLWRPGGPGGMLGGPFPLFLVGLYVGRRQIFENIRAHLPLIRKLMWWGLALGLAGTLVSVGGQWPNPAVPYSRLTRRYSGVLWFLGTPALSFFYASVLIFLAQRETWTKRLAPLAAVGRTALSNYLLQSLVFTTAFYGYGLRLYGKIGPAANLALTVLIYAIEIAMSVWWMRRFRFGPAEWLWRTLTYGKLQPMRAAAG